MTSMRAATWLAAGITAVGLTVGCGGGTDERGVPTGTSDSEIKTLGDFMMAAAKTKLTEADIDKFLKCMAEVKQVEDSPKPDMGPGGDFDLTKTIEEAEGHAPTKAVLDKHDMTARELVYKLMATQLAMQRLDAEGLKNVKTMTEALEKRLADMKANPDLPEQQKKQIPKTEEALAMNKKMIKAIEAVPQSTVDAVKAKQDEIKSTL